MRRPRASLSPWALALVLAVAAWLALARSPAAAPPLKAATTSARYAGPDSANQADDNEEESPQVPARALPPGSSTPDRGPSEVIFPPQNLTLHFDHRLHVTSDAGPHLRCETCHAAARTSTSSRDVLTPKGTTCDGCHGIDHRNVSHVVTTTRAAIGTSSGKSPDGACATCHDGYDTARPNAVVPFELPRANLVFDHRAHAARNIGCPQCHGDVGEVGLATRDQLPRMRGCFGCHQMADSASRGEAKSDCVTCHVRPSLTKGGGTEEGIGGRMRTTFASGTLLPPQWLHGAEHTPDFIERHRLVAGNDSQFCSNCHREEFCTDCHDGRVRPRNIHPNDYISMHAVEARLATSRCTSCHQEQTFCLQCHQRLGITMTGPADVRESSRFHPPRSLWSDPPMRPGHHGFEAERNLNACVSCHVERDCITCHGARGVGGGFDPHGRGFAGGCATQLHRNPRPCYVCHDPGDAVLRTCR